MGDNYRFNRRLFSHLNSLEPQKVSEVGLSRYSLPVSSTPVQLGGSIAKFYEDYSGSRGFPKTPPSSYIHVFGRLTSQEPVQADPDQAEGINFGDTSIVRALAKREKVVSRTYTKNK